MGGGVIPGLRPETTASFDIMGVCVSRDVFGMSDDSVYTIRRYVRLSLPFFTDDETIGEDQVATEDMFEGKGFRVLKKLDEMNRRYGHLRESGADWLLLDLMCISYEYYELRYNGGTHYYLSDPNAQLTPDEIRMAINKRGYELESIGTAEADDIPGIGRMADAACDFIRERYGGNVILLQVKDGIWGLDRSGRVCSIQSEEAEKRRKVLDKYYRIFQKKLGCHCIRMPAENICDLMHKWGFNTVHYVQEYYDYALACISDIVSGAPDLDRTLGRRYMKFCAELDAIRAGTMLSRNNTVKRIMRPLSIGRPDLALAAANRFGKEAANPALECEIGGIIGRIWYERTDGKADPEKAEAYMREAAEAGIPWCEAYLLRILWERNKDGEMAEKAEEFAQKGNNAAMGFLGRAYRDGRGREKDAAKAEEWLLKAAERRVRWAGEELEELRNPASSSQPQERRRGP